MPRVRVAAVQASYVLMDNQATLDKVAAPSTGEEIPAREAGR
jgi:hypothetical protein